MTAKPKVSEPPRNLCVDTGTMEHSEECRAQWGWSIEAPEQRCEWSHIDHGRCYLLPDHHGHHRYGPR